MKKKSITQTMLKKFEKDFKAEPKRRIVQNAIIKNGIQNVAINYKSKIKMQYTFSEEIDTGEYITNQKSSGRCWLFAGLNLFRHKIADRYKLKDFELSQSYQMFWDKLEKANYFLENIIETKNEPLNGRLVMWLLQSPLQDGGQWDMFVNLVKKYGVVPKTIMPETYHSSNSYIMNKILTLKLREFANELRNFSSKDTKKLSKRKDEMLNEIYKMLVYFLGEPPKTFDFEYTDTNKAFHRDENLTPIRFFEKYVDMNLDDYISIINAPTSDKPFNKIYTIKYLGNVVGGKDILYLNVDVDTMEELAMLQIRDKEPVWFGCDVGQMMDKDSGIMDMQLYDYFGALDSAISLTKELRLNYMESRLTHAMVFTGVNIKNGKPNRWKVENSWSDKSGNKGFYIMSSEWFKEYNYQIVVNKRYLNAKLREVLKEKPIELEPWDPMGSLALMR